MNALLFLLAGGSIAFAVAVWLVARSAYQRMARDLRAERVAKYEELSMIREELRQAEADRESMRAYAARIAGAK